MMDFLIASGWWKLLAFLTALTVLVKVAEYVQHHDRKHKR
jgi:hypothetical protein